MIRYVNESESVVNGFKGFKVNTSTIKFCMGKRMM